MSQNKVSDQMIDDFLFGILKPEDARNIEREMINNKKLTQEITLRKEVISGFEAHGRMELKKELIDIHKEVVQPKSRGIRRIIPYFTAAASVALLVVAFMWLSQGSALSNQDLYDNYFEPYNISGIQRSTGNQEIAKLKELYNNKSYQAALPMIENLLQTTDNKSSDLLMAAGVSYLELNQADKALVYFNQITEKGDFNF